jgi:hypothetical protein
MQVSVKLMRWGVDSDTGDVMDDVYVAVVGDLLRDRCGVVVIVVGVLGVCGLVL